MPGKCEACCHAVIMTSHLAGLQFNDHARDTAD